MTRYAISDIHGNLKALLEVLKKSKFDYNKDELIIVGDIVDGYSDSYYVVEEILKIKNVKFIIGNHDVFWMSHMATGWAEKIWLMQGGLATLESYKSQNYNYKKIPKNHKDFYNNGVYWYEVDNMLFVHGGFNYPTLPKDSDIYTLTWDRELFYRCMGGLKIKEWNKVFIGHTATEDSKPCIMDNVPGAKVINIDCGAGWKGRLCLYDIDTDKYFLSKQFKGHDKY